MTWGIGWGGPWGPEQLIQPEDPVAQIAAGPISFLFEDEADGPLPGAWETYALDWDGAGAVAIEAEVSPNTYYRTSGGLGLWKYTRAPTVPGPTDPYSERGVAAGPTGVLVGRDARLAVVFRQPTQFLVQPLDTLFFEVILGTHLVTSDASFVGGRVQAAWTSGGGWSPKLALDVVSASGGAPTSVASATVPTEPDPLDVWEVYRDAELEVELRGTTLTATLNGVLSVEAQVPAGAEARPVLFVRAYTTLGAFIRPVAVVSALKLESLRDLDRLGPPPQILGHQDEDHPDFPLIRLPVSELLDQKLITQVGARRFRVLTDFSVEVQAQQVLFRAGEFVLARERYVGQTFVPVSLDLAAQRNAQKWG